VLIVACPALPCIGLLPRVHPPWQDIELVIQAVSPLIRPGCVAAFSETELGGGLEVSKEAMPDL